MKKSTIALGLLCGTVVVIGGGYTYVANQTGKAIEQALAQDKEMDIVRYERGVFSSHIVQEIHTASGTATIDTEIEHLKYNLTKHAYTQVKSLFRLPNLNSQYEILADVSYPKNEAPYPTADNFKGDDSALNTAQAVWLINGVLNSGLSVKIENKDTQVHEKNWPLMMGFSVTDGGKKLNFDVANFQSPLLTVKGLQGMVKLNKPLQLAANGTVPNEIIGNSPDHRLKAEEIDVTTLALAMLSGYGWQPSTQDYYQIRNLSSYQDTDKNNLAKGKFTLDLNAVQAGKITPIFTLTSASQGIVPSALQAFPFEQSWINEHMWQDPKFLASLAGTKGDGDLVLSTTDGKKSDIILNWDVKKDPSLIAEGKKDVASFSVKTSLNPQQLVNITQNLLSLYQDKKTAQIVSGLVAYGLKNAQEWRPQTGPILQKQSGEKDANLIGTLEFKDGEWKLNGNVIDMPPLY